MRRRRRRDRLGTGVREEPDESGADGQVDRGRRDRRARPVSQPTVKAEVETDGRIQVRGRGLLRSGGNGIGDNASASVFATLICEAAAPFTERSTAAAGVKLEANGDFRINDTLDSVPSECPSAVLLIRSVATRRWFAAGIRKFEDDDE